MDQFQAWVGNEPAGPSRETWDEAAQDAVSAGHAAWVTDCLATAISWSTVPASISRTIRPVTPATRVGCDTGDGVARKK
jgi:hypothetical protein